MEIDTEKTTSVVDQLTSDDDSPKGGVGGNEHCVAIISRKARLLYMFKAKRKLI